MSLGLDLLIEVVGAVFGWVSVGGLVAAAAEPGRADLEVRPAILLEVKDVEQALLSREVVAKKLLGLRRGERERERGSCWKPGQQGTS